MKLWLVADEYDYILTETPWSTEPLVEVSEAFWKRYQAYEQEKDVIQEELYQMYKAAKRKELIDTMPKVDYSKSF